MIAICGVLIAFILTFIYTELNKLNAKLDKILNTHATVEKACPVYQKISVAPVYSAPSPASTLLNR